MKNLDKLFWAFVLLLWTAVTSAEPYRSKIYHDPEKKLTKSVSLSLKELEQQFSSFTDAYNISSAGQQLANSYLQQGEYKKAAEYFEKSLAAEGLADAVNQQILLQLSKIYLLLTDYKQALITLERAKKNLTEVPFELTILTAQAQYGMSDYLGISETLEPAFEKRQQLNESQLKQMLALYHNSSHYHLSIKILQQLLQQHSDVSDYWLQLTSIYLMQNQYKNALDQLALARQKKIYFRESDLLLLTDLYLLNKAPEQGAKLLQQAIENNEIEDKVELQNKLFNLWLQARENKFAIAAAQRSLQLAPDTELSLSLAGLQMDERQWQQMNQTMLQSCTKVLEDKYVSKANLLLGISQFKLGDKEAARRSLINATLIGGSGDKARQWLKFIQAKPATLNELSEITKPCIPEDPDVYIGAIKIDSQTQTSQSNLKNIKEKLLSENTPKLVVKTVKKLRLYTVQLTTTLDQLAVKTKINFMKLAMALVKAGGSIDGPFQLIHNQQKVPSQSITLTLAIPYKGSANSKGRYRPKSTKNFKCASTIFQGSSTELAEQWKTLYEQSLKQGLKPTGTSRTVILKAGVDGGNPTMELQLGIE
ncbi:MAG: hypothetical protein DRQ47_04775 [Gammaproteobacteria bacterium]|nr:MAG: hypothetical protein DRQ47_04775 [Gammaproteobacteria bacterium]